MMGYEDLARRVVQTQCADAELDEACAALDTNEDAFLAAVDAAILSHGDGVKAIGHAAEAAASVWRNWGGNQLVHAQKTYDLAKLSSAQLQAIVREASASQSTLKVVGSGHSFSDILQTKGALLFRSQAAYAGDIPLLYPIDLATLKKAPQEMLIQMAANAKLSELNAALAKQKLAFRNLGGAAYQTLAGAVSTSTHGSGLSLGALCDEIRSVLFVDATGALRRIEPANGISDPGKHRLKHADVELVQDDDLFRAWTVSMGCMGIAVQITMHVTKAFKLKETRARAQWSVLKQELAAGKHLAARHFEVLIDPYPKANGDHDCVTATREEVSSDSVSSNPGGRPGRWFASRRVFQRLLQRSVQKHPERIPKLVDRSLTNVHKMGEFVNDSYHVFDIGDANDIRVVSQELAFDLQDGECFEAVDAILQQIAAQRAQGLWHPGPVALRFVAASPMHLSMMHGRATCMVELPILDGTPHWEEMFKSYEKIAAQHDGRPHWGQYHALTGEPGWLDAHYDEAYKWKRAHAKLDPHGRFDNAFVERMRFRDPPGAAEIDALWGISDEDLLAANLPHALPVAHAAASSTDGVAARVRDLAAEHGPMIRALCEVMLPDPIIPWDETTDRALQLLAQLRPPLSDNLDRAIGAAKRVLPLLVGGARAFDKLPLRRRERAIKRCFEGGALRRDLAQAIKLVTVFPYYTDPRVMKAIGYLPFEDRPRSAGIDLTPLRHVKPGASK